MPDAIFNAGRQAHDAQREIARPNHRAVFIMDDGDRKINLAGRSLRHREETGDLLARGADNVSYLQLFGHLYERAPEPLRY